MPRLRDLLLDPRIRNGALDDDELLEAHEHIVREKRLLRSAFLTFYATLTRLCDRYFRVDGLELELGSGAGFFKEVRPGLITSDVRKSPRIDRVIDALAMDIPDDSVRCIYAINVFHHLPSPDTFFLEISRTLRRGGVSSLWSRTTAFFPHGCTRACTRRNFLTRRCLAGRRPSPVPCPGQTRRWRISCLNATGRFLKSATVRGWKWSIPNMS
ncbi:MAG: class I SAM-dependent methyltransferase [Desulfovibrio sp.]|nr:class I SAM-dependent methyltransferase [Desulfovibrio sp.]